MQKGSDLEQILTWHNEAVVLRQDLDVGAALWIEQEGRQDNGISLTRVPCVQKYRHAEWPKLLLYM